MIERPENYLTEVHSFLGMELDQKRKKIKEFIYKSLPQLKQDWDTINSKIGTLNEDRRHLIHGIGQSYFLKDVIKTVIRKGQNVILKEYSIADINSLTNKLAHLLTGDNGLDGEFLTKFSKHLFDNYNKSAPDDKKIVYRVNGTIQTEWVG